VAPGAGPADRRLTAGRRPPPAAERRRPPGRGAAPLAPRLLWGEGAVRRPARTVRVPLPARAAAAHARSTARTAAAAAPDPAAPPPLLVPSLAQAPREAPDGPRAEGARAERWHVRRRTGGARGDRDGCPRRAAPAPVAPRARRGRNPARRRAPGPVLVAVWPGSPLCPARRAGGRSAWPGGLDEGRYPP
jgi:hypothetical protein